jgi:hypothetical protein
LLHNRTLKSLDISGKFPFFRKALFLIRQIYTIDGSFGINGARSLASMLQSNTSLTSLNIQRHIENDSEKVAAFNAISASLVHNNTMKILDLSISSGNDPF